MRPWARFCLMTGLFPLAVGAAPEKWSVILPANLERDAAIRSAIQDLREAGSPLGIEFIDEETATHRIVVKTPSGGKNADLQGFELVTSTGPQGHPIVVLESGSSRGAVYGLYWIWDRLRVYGKIPVLNTKRSPRLKIRFSEGSTPESIRNALRYTATWVTGADTLKLFVWEGIEPEDSQNRKYREEVQARVDLAHSYHLKFLPRCDEFTYLPAYLEKMNATLTPEDPNLWKALQEKYRQLFRAMPGLDGIVVRTGELTRVFGNYRAFDIIHEPRDLDWSLDRRYRIFVKRMHEVVVGEFGKIYFQRTWETSGHEHHSNPDLFRKTFTPDVPTENLYLSPYMSLADRWYYQPYNPTFNLTGHRMVVLLATLDYHAHAGIPVFPSFPGPYHQGGLRHVLSSDQCNLVGAQFATPVSDDWTTRNLTGYTVYRLLWNPEEDLREIAHDFAAISLGREAADAMAEAILLSATAYKDGIYVKPVAEGIRGNTLPHLRIGTFPVRGIPEIDGGREHIEWLEATIYQPCRDRREETLEPLERGLEAARRMEVITLESAPRIRAARRETAVSSARLTRWLVETNVNYIRTCLDYFRYRETPSDLTRHSLENSLSALEESRAEFIRAPGFRFKLFGIDQLISNTKEILEDREKAEEKLRGAPPADEVLERIAQQQKHHRAYLNTHREELVPVLHWRGRIDGRDLLLIQGDTVSIRHLQGDGADVEVSEILSPLPPEEGSLVVEDMGSAPYGPFVLEHPTRENGFTGKIFLYDRDPSYGRWEFKIHRTGRSPEEAGLEPKW